MAILMDVAARPDAGSFKKAASFAEKTFATAGREASSAFSKSFAAGAKDVQAAVSQYQKAYDKVADAAGKVKTSESELQRLRDKSKSQAAEVEALEKRLADAREKEGAESKAAATATRELDRARDQLAATNTKIVRTSESIAKTERDQKRQIRDTVQAYRELEEAQRRAHGGFLQRIRGGAGGLAQGLTSNMGGVVGQFGMLGGGAGKAFVAGAIASIVAGNLVSAVTGVARTAVAAMKSVFDTGLDFERTFNKLQGVTRANPADMAAMRAQAEALGNDLTLPGVSSKDALEAMLELSKGGLGLADIQKSVRGTLLLSTAAGISPADAAQSQASVLQSFNLDPSAAGHVADLLTATQQVAPGDIPDFALALQQAGTVAHGFGISVEDTLATLGTFAKAGIVGSDAGTSLKTLLTHLANPSGESAGAMSALGVTPNDPTTGKFIGMRALFQQLHDAAQRMRPDEFQRNVSQLFGTDAIRGAMIAGDQGPKMFDEVMAEFTHGGQAQEMGAAMMQGWPGIVEKIHNGIDSIKMSLFDLFKTPGVQKFGDQIVAEIAKIGKWVDTHKSEIATYFGNFVSGGLRALNSIGGFVSGSIRVLALFEQVSGRILGTVTHLLADFANMAGSVLQKMSGFSIMGFHPFGSLNGLGKDLQDASKGMHSFADMSFHMGDNMNSFADGIDKARANLPQFADNVDKFAKSAAQAFKLTDAVDQAITQLPDGKTITIKDNSPEVDEKLKALGFEVQKLPDGSFSIIPKTDEAKQILDAWRAQQNNTPVTPPVQPDTGPGNSTMQQFVNQWKNTLISPTVAPPPPGAPSPVPSLLDPHPHAAGGIFGSMPSHATIAGPSGKSGLVQWAEDSTKGEAYIPLGGGRRSIDIWARTGRLLGVFDEGGFRNADQGGGYGHLYQVAAALTGGPYVWGDTDCSGAVSKLVNAAVGGSGRMDTSSAAGWLTEKGFVLGQGPPGTFRIGWHQGGPGGGHMAATLPDGTHFESGGSHGGILMGAGAAGAEDGQFDRHAYLPMQALYPDGRAGGGGGGGFSPAGFGSGGGGAGGGGSAGGGGGGFGGGGAAGGAGGGGGFFSPADPAKVRDAEQRVQRADAKVQLLEQKQHELKANASQSERMRLEQQLKQAREEAQDARQDLAKVQQGKFHPGRAGGGAAGGMGQIGAPLDADFGMKGGLPGLAKNLVTFLGNLAFAPALGALSAVTSAFGGGQGGSGLLGMMATGLGGGGGFSSGAGYGAAGYTPGFGTDAGLNPQGLGPDAAAAMSARGGMGASGGVGGASPMGFGTNVHGIAPGTTGPAPGGASGGVGGLTPGGGTGGGLTPFGRGGPPSAGPFGGGGLPGMGGPGNSVLGGQQMAGSHGSGIGIGGGLIGLAESLPGQAASAAGGMFPGGGAAGAMIAQAAQIGIDEINRGVAFAGQVAGIGASGLLETFNLNDSALADPSKSWLGRLAIGISGAKPAVPNLAGMMAQQPQGQGQGKGEGAMGLKTANPGGQGQGQGDGQDGQGGTNIHLEYHNHQATEDRAGADINRHLSAQYQDPGTR